MLFIAEEWYEKYFGQTTRVLNGKEKKERPYNIFMGKANNTRTRIKA